MSSTLTGDDSSIDRPRSASQSRAKPTRTTQNRLVRAAPKPRLAERLAERMRQLAARSWRVIFVGLIAFGLGAGGFLAWRLVTTHPRFAIAQVRFAGLTAVSEHELQATLGTALGENIFRFDRRAAAQRLQSHPKIVAAQLHRVLPSTLQIDVTERRPAVLVSSGEGLFIADEQGHVYDHAAVKDSEGLVTITGLDIAGPGPQNPTVAEHIRQALDLAKRWHQHPTRPPLSEISVHPSLGFSLFLREGAAEIRLGRGDIDQKLARYDTLAKELGSRNEKFRAMYLDAGRSDRIAVKLQTTDDGS